MDAGRRQQYLDAMDITRYVRRLPERPVLQEAPVETAVPKSPPQAGTAEPAHQGDWERLKARVASCTACDLHVSRTQTVFGVGDEQARLMIIGEAPGADEDRQGEPFVGRAGQLLNAMLNAIGLQRNAVYIANILKCRPPGNRNPVAEEIIACRPFLLEQMRLLRPRVMLAVGGVAAHNLLETDESVGRLRKRVHRYGETGIPLLVTYHPAYLLRRPEEKAKAWEDLQRLHQLLHQE